MPGSASAGNTDRSSVAPVATTAIGSTPGAVVAKLESILLTNADCAAEMLNAPPRTWKTIHVLIFLLASYHMKANLQ